MRTALLFDFGGFGKIGYKTLCSESTAVTWLALFGTKMLFWVTCSFFGSTVVRPERKKWNTYSFTEFWTIGVLHFFAIFFGILLVIWLRFSLFRCFREPVVMSAVHLERWNNLCRQKRTTFGTSANRKEQPLAGGTPPRTPPDSIFCIACKQQPGADQFTEGCGHFCTNFRIP